MKGLLLSCVAAFCVLGAAAHAEDKKYTVAGIVFQEDQFMKSALMGMKSVADANGVNLLTGNSSNQISKEVQLVNTYTTRGVDAIVMTYLDPAAASVPAVKAANDKGIKVVSFNNTLAADFPISTVQSDNELLGAGTGKEAAAYIRSHYAGKSEIKVAVLNYKTQLPPESAARQGGFWGEIKDIPGVTLVAESSTWLAEDSVKKAGDILTAHPDLDLIYACNDGATIGAVLAVKNAGKKVPVFGIDIDKQLVGFIQSPDNILQASTAQDPFKIGSVAMENAVKALKGEQLEKKVIVPGITLTRSDPAALEAFAQSLK